MGSYFKPLRRKVGVVALVSACMFMGMWVRSLQRYDTLIVFTRVDTTGPFPVGVVYSFKSIPHSAVWMISRQGDESYSLEDTKKHFAKLWLDCRSRVVEPRYVSEVLKYFPRRILGFGLGESQPPSSWPLNSHFILAVPYWSVIIPLTIISAWMMAATNRGKTPTSEAKQ